MEKMRLSRPHFWGRKHVRCLKKSQIITHFLQILPTLSVEQLVSEKGLYTKSLYLEIGFGGGEHLLEQAKRNPQSVFLGCDPFINGVIKLLKTVQENYLKNIRIFVEDGRYVLQSLQTKSLDGCFILFADPWPKKRHHKRRIINQETLNELSRLIKPTGFLRLTTDHPSYQEWIKNLLKNQPWFEERFYLETHPNEWPYTRYEEKALIKGTLICYWELTLKQS